MSANQINIKDFYDHETRIRMVENAIISIDKRFEQIEKKFEQVDKRFERLENKMDSQFKWTIGLILGLYGSGFIALLGYFLKSKGWA